MNINKINLMTQNHNQKEYKNNSKKANTQDIPNQNGDSISFKGKEPSWLTKFLADVYGKKILNSDKVRKFSENIVKMDRGNASRHFQTVVALVTSSAYVMGSLRNKDFDKKNGRTLAINQTLGFVVPTIAAYTVDSAMNNFNKQLEYAKSPELEKQLAAKKITGKELEEVLLHNSKQLKGVRTFMSIVTFTLVYRYLAPVAITPAANKIGNWVNKKIDQKQETKAQKELKTVIA